jgi:hypothetical protein
MVSVTDQMVTGAVDSGEWDKCNVFGVTHKMISGILNQFHLLQQCPMVPCISLSNRFCGIGPDIFGSGVGKISHIFENISQLHNVDSILANSA